MQIRLNGLLVAAALAIAFTSFLASAAPQDQIALIHDADGRPVYVNVTETAGSKSNSPRLPATKAAGDSAVHKIISQTAHSLAVDPDLVEAMVRVESGYDQRARSPKGALGLMQLMPATAARFSVADPLDAAQNVRGGVLYMGHLLEQFHGDLPLSLAAYNAGEGAVLRAGGIPPFAETQDYIRKVTGLYRPPRVESGTPKSSLLPVPGPLMSTHSAAVDNATTPVPIYRYVDKQGVIHFTQ